MEESRTTYEKKRIVVFYKEEYCEGSRVKPATEKHNKQKMSSKMKGKR